ncbi:MAG: Mannose-6-phosphate isomerase ManA [Phycisphaerae bacterium]|nr:Mannose-6-phosphate isomerase ManA [Phycisphaerae bacterium]
MLMERMSIAMQVCPLKFQPIYKPRLWGGNRLRSHFHRPVAGDSPTGESWEVCDLANEVSVVAEGPMQGRRIDELIREWGAALMGRVALVNGRFPLLIKWLDTAADLSVQVHPDDSAAQALGIPGLAKYEAWYIAHAEPGAVIYKGLRAGVSATDYLQAGGDELLSQLNRVPVRAGDHHYLPGGIVHALGRGILAAEVQTPSDVTYRIYDWNRIDTVTGQPRELHRAQAAKCIREWPMHSAAEQRSHVASHWTTVTRLITSAHFMVEKVRMVGGMDQAIPYAEPVIWMILQGSGRIMYDRGRASLPFQPGDTLLLPAALGDGRVVLQEDAVWLEVTMPAGSDLVDFERPARDSLMDQPSGSGGVVQINLPPRPVK